MTYQQQKVLIEKISIIFCGLIIYLFFKQLYLFSLILLLIMSLGFLYYIVIRKIKETTLCFVVKNEQVLMMLRNKKNEDVHINKYNGLGGKVERGESKEKCILRETYEEAGIILTDYQYVGKVIFKNFGYKIGKEVMYCFIAYNYENDIGNCDEGELEWIHKDKILSLPLWEGDKYFIMNIINNIKFTAFLHYDQDKVVTHHIKLKGNKHENSS